MGKKFGVKTKKVNKLRTICEVHREIYDLVEEVKNKDKREKIITLLEEAYRMGKKMNNKLVQYKNGYDSDWWELNKNYEGSIKRRKVK